MTGRPCFTLARNAIGSDSAADGREVRVIAGSGTAEVGRSGGKVR